MMDYTPEQSKALVSFIKAFQSLEEAQATLRLAESECDLLWHQCSKVCGGDFGKELARVKQYMDTFPEEFK